MKLFSFGESHVGKSRGTNEDAILVRPDLGLFAVADGVGGLPEGDYASARTLDLLADDFAQQKGHDLDLAALVKRVNRQVYMEGRQRQPATGIATTLSCIALQDRRLRLAHAGDSAVYLLRDSGLRTLTTEHTVAAEIQGRREAVPAENIPEHYYHTLTRCIGERDPLFAETLEMDLRSGDRLLLSTDGLTKVLSRTEIHNILLTAATPPVACKNFIKQTLAQGAPDNVSAVVIFLR